MKTLIVINQIKKIAALTALTLAPALALTSTAQAAPKKQFVALQRADILAQKFPAIYDGPHYGGPIAKSQVQTANIAHIRVATSKIAQQKATH